MRALTVVIFLMTLVGASACEDARTSVPVSAPTPLSPPVPPPPVPPPPPPAAAIAVLEMSNVKVIEYPPAPPMRQGYSYLVTFWLAEVTGLSGATIQGIVVSTTGQSEATGQGCWREVIRVEPGGTLDYFERELQSLLYCAPGVGSGSRASYVAIEVTYTDDDGRAGTVNAWVTLPILIQKPHTTSRRRIWRDNVLYVLRQCPSCLATAYDLETWLLSPRYGSSSLEGSES